MESVVVDSSFWKGKKVFLTGHTGFKGAWMAVWLQQLGAQVTGYSLAPDTEPSLYREVESRLKIKSIIGDICDVKSFGQALKEADPEIIFHMAAQPLVRLSYEQPLETFQTNIIGTANLLELSRGLKNLKSIVVITTDKVYENLEKNIAYSENDSLGGHDPYSSSKACAEIVTSAMRRSFYNSPQAAAVATARAGNVIGGGDWAKDRIVPDIVRSSQIGEALKLRNPLAVRPWQHVLEPLAGYLKLAQALYQGERSEFAASWNFGPEGENAVPVEQLVTLMSQEWAGLRWQVEGGSHPHEATLLKLESSKAKKKLNWSPRWGIKKTAQMTMAWYRSYYNKEMPAFELCVSQINDYCGK